MNTKAIVGWAVLVLVVLGGVYFFSRTTPSVPSEQATSTPLEIGTTTTTAPANTAQPHRGPTMVQVETRLITIDDSSLIATSSYVTLTGTTNLSMIGLVILNGDSVGIVGTGAIPVTKGRWSYSVPLKLSHGTYRVQMVGGTSPVEKTLIVK